MNYVTATPGPLTLSLIEEEDEVTHEKTGVFRVTLTGDREKLLNEGKDEVAARRTYNDAHAHYEARKKAESGDS